ncbi:50S ribosomal protein L36 [Candidatus Nasuia deltocephalinicola]|nr:50S ribosomal protein L36 [Candidatus Nasuia deltocephalinicola]
MKVSASIKKKCNFCKIIKRKNILRVYCKLISKHNQKQG